MVEGGLGIILQVTQTTPSATHNPHYEEPQLVQLLELQELHDDPCELVNPSSLLWLKVERNFLTLVPLQVGQVTFWSPKTRVSKSLSHFMQ
jgi:hypothetical protein